MTNPRFAYFGTPVFSTYVLDELERAGHLPVVVVTTPDKPAGRGLQVQMSPVKKWAEARSIPVLQPEKLKEEFRESFRAFDLDLLIVAAYGKILPASVLAIAKSGNLNVHPSLLPRYRGMSPVESQILADEKDVGVSVILMDEDMDHGPIVACERLDIPEWPISRNALNELLWHRGGALLAQALPEFLAGTRTLQEQNHDDATFTKKITKEDGCLDLAASGRENYLKYLAYQGWPGTYFFIEKSGAPVRVKIVSAKFENDSFIPERVVPEGRKEMSYSDLTRS